MRKLIISLILISCSKKAYQNENLNIPNYEQRIENGVIVEYEKNKKNWELKADKIILKGDYYLVYNFVLNFYDENGISATLIGDSGDMNKISKDMRAFSNVVFKSRDSSFLKTNKLYWNDFARRLYTDDSIYIYDAKNKRELYGIGFESDDQFRKIRIFRNVRGKGEGSITK
ncbi:MAG: LPS export ABC transporter periplasmic protein LptC [candidate division WOR-3 bacterium]